MSTRIKRALVSMKYIGALLLLGVAILLSATAASAGLIVIGAPGDPGGGNTFPFGAKQAGIGTRYQQVYNSNQFPGLITIQDLVFFNINREPGSIRTANYDIHLSTTSKAVNGLDTSNFNSNVGANDIQVFNDILTGPVDISTHTFRILLTSTFTYDPSQGNLLLDIFRSNITSEGPDQTLFLDARNGTFGDISSRAHNFGFGFESVGLVTGFSFDQVQVVSAPEPSSFLLMASSLPAIAGAGVMIRRKRFSIG